MCLCIECVGYEPEPYCKSEYGMFSIFFDGKEVSEWFSTEKEAWESVGLCIDYK
jgi:hypothetical protein